MKRMVCILCCAFMMMTMTQPVNAEEYYAENSYIMYVGEEEEIGYYPEIGGDTYATVQPGIYYADAIKNRFYRLVGYENTWIYYYDSMDVKSIQPVTNRFVKLNQETQAYSQPFEEEEFKLEHKVAAGEYEVSKKAFDWLLVHEGDQTYWIHNELGSASFTSTSGVMDYSNISVDFKTQIIDYNLYKRVGFTMVPKSITIHNTANGNPDSDAQKHADLLANPNARAYTSWHFTVDDHQIIQSIPVNEGSWHAGDNQGLGNGASVAIEMCENAGSDWNQTLKNTQVLVAHLMVDLNLPISAVKKHYDFSGKNCPRQLMDPPTWIAFIDGIETIYKGLIGDNGSNVGWLNIGSGNWTYYEADGTRSTHWVWATNGWYYVRNGIMVRNDWVYDAGCWYFMDDDGTMMIDEYVNDGGQYYYLGTNGIWVR